MTTYILGLNVIKITNPI